MAVFSPNGVQNILGLRQVGEHMRKRKIRERVGSENELWTVVTDYMKICAGVRKRGCCLTLHHSPQRGFKQMPEIYGIRIVPKVSNKSS